MRITLLPVAMCGLLGSASAQWNVVAVTQPGFADAEFRDLSSGYQCGFVQNAQQHAAVWHGTASSFVDLNPPGSSSSVATCIRDGVEGGFIFTNGCDHAGLWAGSASSFVDMNPSNWANSVINHIADGQQVGMAFGSSGSHAGVWQGTPDSFVDLNPLGADQSQALAVWNGYQGGAVWWTPLGSAHAALWSGSASSMIDLSPDGSTDSFVYKIALGQEVGFAVLGGNPDAALWFGSKQSFVDLSPPGMSPSYALNTDGHFQVGIVTGTDGHYRAALWSGSASSFIDLGAYAHGYVDTQAWAVEGLSIVGIGTNVRTGHIDALRWIPLPSPVSATAHGH